MASVWRMPKIAWSNFLMPLYESQDLLMADIVQTGCGGVKNNIALLGGIQINTAPTAMDYFLPLRFDYMDNQGNVLEDMLESITGY